LASNDCREVTLAEQVHAVSFQLDPENSDLHLGGVPDISRSVKLPMTFNVAIYACLLCAILMIGGGMILLARGVLKLSSAGKSEEGLTIEILDKFKIRTGVPALGLFVLGLCCIGLAIYYSKPSDAVSLVFEGKLNIDDTSVVTGKIVPVADVGRAFTLDTDGGLETPMHPDLCFEVQINAAGYVPAPWKKQLPVEKGKTIKVDLTNVKFSKKPQSNSPSKGDIVPLPANVNAPPVQEATGFKPPS
jgi:hypothetical protein